MTKTLTIIMLLLTTRVFGQTLTGKLKIGIEEKTKEGKRPVTNETITVVINGSESFTLTTDNEGQVLLSNRPKGSCDVKVIRIDCPAYEIRGVVIGEGKTAYITYTLACATYINSLTKKEKKKLGIK